MTATEISARPGAWQAAYVRERVRERGLTDLVAVVCKDYRDSSGMPSITQAWYEGLGRL
ncbi:hypothetical protein [Streptomyces sp. NPDC054837]